MTDKTIRLSSSGVTTESGWSKVNWTLKGLEPDDFILSHEIPEQDQNLLSDPQCGDHALCAILLKAMEQKDDIVVEGKVSPKLLDGLETLQAIWHRWRPERYQLIKIFAEEECETVPAKNERPAIFAFSGGVDASFTLFRHLHNQAGRNKYKPAAALLIHGMDIPLDRDDFFQNAATRAEQILDGSGVRLIRMRMNCRELLQRWEDSFGLQLAACFLLFQANYADAVRGSEEPYESLIFPWGSTPLTDPLASTACMEMRHDGCDFDRTEKVYWLAKNTKASEYLRVCWEGPRPDRNCGECEKCIRTMLNFWAMDLPIPKAFPTQLTPKRVSSIRIRNRIQHTYLINLLRFAERHHPKDDQILKALQKRLGHTGPKNAARRAGYLAKRILGI
ncbi:hypothetical protein [Ectothiorhodospira shaposhnikovii]|uniref:hypothetical protein n=1 Tax=Ectothiorhodospira shaposhnikovii TaxID=1054 RepID=UPI001EE9A8AE|nr:hypothetical protein [Ectothiorhodospira shaposhnikovii]MCG5512086.1 hypothetical protein [Ectothiorhodospira shaposhnikovii]